MMSNDYNLKDSNKQNCGYNQNDDKCLQCNSDSIKIIQGEKLEQISNQISITDDQNISRISKTNVEQLKESLKIGCEDCADDDQNQSTGDDTTTLKENQLQKSEDKRKINKEYDLKKLEEMLTNIVNYEEKKINLKCCLAGIGTLSGGITVNGDICSKYGYHHQENKLNKNRIQFEKLSHMKSILNDKQINALITTEELKLITKDLSGLKNKIIQILNFEKNLEENSNKSDEQHYEEIESIYDLSDKYFEILTAKLINVEINIWLNVERFEKKSIDFGVRDDRYFIARLLSKIGELLNDLIKGVDITKIGENCKKYLIMAFKNLVGIRNGIVHNCELIAKGKKALNEDISKVILCIKEHLTEVFHHQLDFSELFSIDYQFENAFKFEEDSKNLLKYLSEKHVSVDDCKKILDKFIIEACEILKEDKEGTLDKKQNIKNAKKHKNKIKNKINNINKQFQLYLKELNDFDVINYPTVLSIENKREIMKVGELIEKRGNHLGENNNEADEQKNKKDKMQLIGQELEYFRHIYVNQRPVDKMRCLYQSLLFDHLVNILERINDQINIIEVAENATCTNANVEHLSESDNTNAVIVNEESQLNELKVLVNFYIKETKYKQSILNEQMKDVFPTLFDEFNSIQQGKNKEEFQQRIGDIYHQICDFCLNDSDLNLLLNVLLQILDSNIFLRESIEAELIKFPELKKYDYIIQQIVLNNQQLIIDEETFHRFYGIIKNYTTGEEDYQLVLSHFNEYGSLKYIEEGKQASRGYRSNGLAHNILSYDFDTFYKDTIDDTVNISDYMNSLNCISNPNNLSSVTELYNMAEAFYRIRVFSQCVSYLERALVRAKSHPEEVWIDDQDQNCMKIFRKPKAICQIYEMLIDSFALSLEYEKMFERVKEMINDINLEEVKLCNVPVLKKCASHFYCHAGLYFHKHKRQLSKAIEFYEKADSIYEDFDTKYRLAYIHYEMKNFEKAKELGEFVLKHEVTPDLQIRVLHLFRGCDIENPAKSYSPENARGLVNLSEFIHQNSRKVLKRTYQDRYCYFEYLSILSKLTMINSEVRETGLKESHLRELSEIDKQFQNTKEQLNVRNIAFLYLSFCRGYCHVYTDKNIVFDKDGTYLKTAIQYFNIALEKLVQVNLMAEKSGSLYELVVNAAHLIIKSSVCYAYQTPEDVDTEYKMYLIPYALDLAEEFNDGTGKFLLVTGILCVNLAGIYIAKCIVEFDKNDYSKALELYWRSLSCYEQRKVQISEENNTNMEINDISYLMAECITNMALLQCDFKLFRYWIFHYNAAISLSSTGQQRRFQGQLNAVKDYVTNLTNVLVIILGSGDDSIEPGDYTKYYCYRNLNIKISYQNKKIQWKHEGNIKNKELRNNIKTELSYIGQLLLIYMFVMDYYKLENEKIKKGLS